jgi:copper chaperone CopZ
MSSKAYHVPNISCAHCVATIERELRTISGVKDVTGDVETKQVAVGYEGDTVPGRVERMLEEIGYPAAA